MRKLVQTMLKYEQETSFSMQAQTVQSRTYRAEKDYMALPLKSTKGENRGKIIIPATKSNKKAKRLLNTGRQ